MHKELCINTQAKAAFNGIYNITIGRSEFGVVQYYLGFASVPINENSSTTFGALEPTSLSTPEGNVEIIQLYADSFKDNYLYMCTSPTLQSRTRIYFIRLDTGRDLGQSIAYSNDSVHVVWDMGEVLIFNSDDVGKTVQVYIGYEPYSG